MTAYSIEYYRLENMNELGFGNDAMKRIKVCAVCGMTAAAEETVCISCRALLPEETLFQQYRKRHRRCVRCDTVVPSESRFCPCCGSQQIV